jgi:hypothetical protein
VGRTVETRAAWLDSAQGGKRSAASLVAGPQPDPSESKGNARLLSVDQKIAFYPLSLLKIEEKMRESASF